MKHQKSVRRRWVDPTKTESDEVKFGQKIAFGSGKSSDAEDFGRDSQDEPAQSQMTDQTMGAKGRVTAVNFKSNLIIQGGKKIDISNEVSSPATYLPKEQEKAELGGGVPQHITDEYNFGATDADQLNAEI